MPNEFLSQCVSFVLDRISNSIYTCIRGLCDCSSISISSRTSSDYQKPNLLANYCLDIWRRLVAVCYSGRSGSLKFMIRHSQSTSLACFMLHNWGKGRKIYSKLSYGLGSGFQRPFKDRLFCIPLVGLIRKRCLTTVSHGWKAFFSKALRKISQPRMTALSTDPLVWIDCEVCSPSLWYFMSILTPLDC